MAVAKKTKPLWKLTLAVRILTLQWLTNREDISTGFLDLSLSGPVVSRVHRILAGGWPVVLQCSQAGFLACKDTTATQSVMLGLVYGTVVGRNARES